MDGYVGGWGLALVDLDCDEVILVSPEHSQYPASAGKIVIVITALRAVQEGELAFEGEVQEDIEVILSKSLDAHSDRLNDKVTHGADRGRARTRGRLGGDEVRAQLALRPLQPARPGAHLDLARARRATRRGAHGVPARPRDAARAGPGLLAVPPEWGVEGYTYGQKAGYWTSPTPIGYRVSAGYAHPSDASSEGYVFAFLIRAVWQDLVGDWQRPVFPLVRDFIVGELGAEAAGVD